MSQNYDVALSFAPDDREIARRIADALKKEGIRVFFDETAGPELWGAELSEYFKKIYQESRLCVVLISKSYQQNNWTMFELRNLLAHSSARGSFSVLPIMLSDNITISDTVAALSLQQLQFIDYKKTPLPRLVEIIQSVLKELPLSREDSSPERYHVIRRETGWSVKREGASRATSIHKTQQEAIRAAKRITLRKKPAELVVHRADGTIQSHQQFAS